MVGPALVKPGNRGGSSHRKMMNTLGAMRNKSAYFIMALEIHSSRETEYTDASYFNLFFDSLLLTSSEGPYTGLGTMKWTLLFRLYAFKGDEP